jgi:hypothetical protein
MAAVRLHGVVGTRLWIVAPAALALAWGSVLVDAGPNQNAHMARVTAIAHGTTRIDPYRKWTRDTAWFKGHYYAAKAPGLALVTLPWYFALEETGLLVHGPPPSVPWPYAETLRMPHAASWEFALWGSVLPFLGLLILVRRVTEQLVPGYGTVTAVTLGAGSLVAVFSNIFFDHELSAALGFAAFAILFRERTRGPSSRLLLAGGLTAGLATVVEFPVAILAVLLGVYALAGPDRLRRGLAYVSGVVLGLVPLGAYDLWEAGSLKPIGYAYAVRAPGRSGHDVLGANSTGFFGIDLPSLSALTRLLLSPKGLFVITPVWAIAIAGLVALWRSGRRAESALAGGVCAAFLLYNAAYYLPFGGFNSGPRFLVPMLPFLALGLAAAWRAWPGPTLALACASVVVTTVTILANPMLVAEDVGTVFHRLERGGDQNGPLSLTVFHWFWSARTGPLLLIGAFVVAVVAVTYTPVARRLTRRDVVLELVALGAWRIAYAGGTVLDRAPHGWTVAAVLALELVGIVALLIRGSRWAILPALLVVPAGWPRFTGHTSLALLLVSGALVALAAAAVRSRRAVTPAAP